MKNALYVVALVLTLSNYAFAGSRILSGRDDQGKPCSLEILQVPRSDNHAWGTVRTSYSGNMLFELSPFYGPNGSVSRDRLHGTRATVSASTRMEFEVVYVPAQRLFVYGDMRTNARTGEIFYELFRECRLGQ